MGEKKPRLTLIGFMVIVLIIGGIVALLIPIRQDNRSSARRAACKGNLRQIGIALHLYADDFNGAFPTVDPVPPAMDADPTRTVQAFGLLYACRYTDNVRIFSCPETPSHYKDFAPGNTLKTNSVSYAYDCRHASNHAGMVILAGDCQDGAKEVSANHGRAGGNYLAIDSSVMWFRAPPLGQKLVIGLDTDPGGIWHRTDGYVHDTCLRRTDK